MRTAREPVFTVLVTAVSHFYSGLFSLTNFPSSAGTVTRTTKPSGLYSSVGIIKIRIVVAYLKRGLRRRRRRCAYRTTSRTFQATPSSSSIQMHTKDINVVYATGHLSLSLSLSIFVTFCTFGLKIRMDRGSKRFHSRLMSHAIFETPQASLPPSLSLSYDS